MCCMFLFIIIYTKMYPFKSTFINRMFIICLIAIPFMYSVLMTMLAYYMMKYAKKSSFFLTNIRLFRLYHEFIGSDISK